MSVWNAVMDGLDDMHGKNVAIRPARELVGAMAGAHSGFRTSRPHLPTLRR